MGVAITHPTRYFFVYDRSSDPAVSYAVQAMVASLDNLWYAYPGLPYPIYQADHANNGVCGQFDRPDASFMTVCAGDPGGGQLASVSWGMTFGNHVVNPWVFVKPGLDVNTAFTTVCGMIGRSIGLDDNPDPDSCMHPVTTVGELQGFTGTDLVDLLGIYYSHYPG